MCLVMNLIVVYANFPFSKRHGSDWEVSFIESFESLIFWILRLNQGVKVTQILYYKYLF